MSRDRNLSLPVTVLALALNATGAVADDRCPAIAKVYIPLATAVAPFGLRAETRAQFLDRVYGRGRGRWREGDDAQRPRTATDADGGGLRVEFPAQTRGQVDLFVETQIEELEKKALRPLFGHRALATYTLDADAQAHLRVPRAAFRESGALLIVVAAPAADDVRVWQVYAWPIKSGACEQRIYVRDRATAIRLTREAK